jgi:hypothetical protein
MVSPELNSRLQKRPAQIKNVLTANKNALFCTPIGYATFSVQASDSNLKALAVLYPTSGGD